MKTLILSRRNVLALLAGAVLLTGCSAAQLGESQGLSIHAAGLVSHADDRPIPVCTSVIVDQAFWPLPMDEDTRNGLSGLLVGRLREAARGRGVAEHYSFYSDPVGRIPVCHDARSIRIGLAYGLNHERRPFVVTQVVTIAGRSTREIFVRDIEGERRAGRLRHLAIDDPMATAVDDDIATRAISISASFLTGK